MPKQKWVKPELVVLVRGRPEEAILQGCRTDGSTATSGTTKAACTSRTSGACGTPNCLADVAS